MDRREFIHRSLLGAAGASVVTLAAPSSLRAADDPAAPSGRPASTPSKPAGPPPRAEDVLQRLLELGSGWIDAKETVDTFKAGDPRTVVEGIAVAWMGYTSVMREARRLGCNLLVVHEPIYYSHRDESVPDFPAAREKEKYLKESGLVVFRCHDVWDRVAKIGIRDAWAGFLGLGKEVGPGGAADPAKGMPFCGVYEVGPIPAGQFARRVAGKVASLGQGAVGLVGPVEKTIRRVAIGTGAITPFEEMVFDLKADLALCTDDGFCLWRDGSLAVDMACPVVVVHHGVAEEIGVKMLAEHLARTFPGIPVRHLAQRSMVQTVSAAE